MEKEPMLLSRMVFWAAVGAFLLFFGYLMGIGYSRKPLTLVTTQVVQQESSETAPSHLLDLNRIDAGELDALPGIGEALAKRILAYREEHNGFQSIEELLDVPGIGPKKFEAIAPYITVEVPYENSGSGR